MLVRPFSRRTEVQTWMGRGAHFVTTVPPFQRERRKRPVLRNSALSTPEQRAQRHHTSKYSSRRLATSRARRLSARFCFPSHRAMAIPTTLHNLRVLTIKLANFHTKATRLLLIRAHRSALLSPRSFHNMFLRVAQMHEAWTCHSS